MPKQNPDVPDHSKDYEQELAIAIGQRIKKRRSELRITQEILRVRLEIHSVFITRSQLSRLENGQRMPVASEIIALSQVLKVSFEWLLLGTNGE